MNNKERIEKNIKKQNNRELAILKVDNFSKAYKKKYVVRNASFQVYKGEFHGFIGANGAGKTTTIKSIIGAYAKYEGRVSIFGKDNRSKEAKKRIGYIPETANFPKNLNTFEYISSMASMAGLSLKESKIFAREKIQEVGLEALMFKRPINFSSGQKKKVLLAQALVNDPDIIVMDEPAANLDPNSRKSFFEQLQKLQKMGKAIFISSHILAELGNFVDSVTILDGGKVVFSGKTKDILENNKFDFNISFRKKGHEKKFIQEIGKSNLKHSNSINKTNSKKYSFKNEKNLDKFLAFIFKNKLSLEYFEREKLTLEDAYDFFVKQGSVETGVGPGGKGMR